MKGCKVTGANNEMKFFVRMMRKGDLVNLTLTRYIRCKRNNVQEQVIYLTSLNKYRTEQVP